MNTREREKTACVCVFYDIDNTNQGQVQARSEKRHDGKGEESLMSQSDYRCVRVAGLRDRRLLWSCLEP